MSTLARRRLLMAFPVAGAALLGAGCWKMLGGMQDGHFDPHAIRTDITTQSLPVFDLEGLPALGSGFSSRDLAALDHPVLINFFASWCIPCVAEMAALRRIATRIPVWGIAYKDKPDDASRFVRRDGSPYARTALDLSGMTAIDWGVTGVPESFLIMPGGRIAWHGAEALNDHILETEILPLTGRKQ